MLQRLVTLALAAVVLCGFPASVNAARVSATEGTSTVAPELIFSAFTGEANVVRIASSSTRTTVSDLGAPLRVGEGCRRVDRNQAVCHAVQEVSIELRDSRDSLTVIGIFEDEAGHILAGAGNDRISLSRARFHNTGVYGGPGSDRVGGGPGRDYILAGRGDDSVAGRPGRDLILGGEGRDTLVGGYGRDTLSAGPGNDSLYVRDGTADAVDGGIGRDRAQVDRGVDELLRLESFF